MDVVYEPCKVGPKVVQAREEIGGDREEVDAGYKIHNRGEEKKEVKNKL